MKPADVDKFFNRRVIISELEVSFNDDDVIEAVGIADCQTEKSVVEEVVQK